MSTMPRHEGGGTEPIYNPFLLKFRDNNKHI